MRLNARRFIRWSFVGAWLTAVSSLVTAAQQQPVAFPHSTHMQLGMQCVDCHSGADIRAAATIPSVRKCMLCHAKISKEKPEIQKIVAYANKNIEIPWVRVYGFSPDAHVLFQHAPHYRAGIPCSSCHGDLTKAATAQRVVTHTMGTCLNCHRQKHATDDCAACHY